MARQPKKPTPPRAQGFSGMPPVSRPAPFSTVTSKGEEAQLFRRSPAARVMERTGIYRDDSTNKNRRAGKGRR